MSHEGQARGMGVYSHMNQNATRLMESLVTLGAGVLLVPHVSFDMRPQVSSLSKSLFTVRAEEWLFSRVYSTVIVQAT